MTVADSSASSSKKIVNGVSKNLNKWFWFCHRKIKGIDFQGAIRILSKNYDGDF